MSRYQPRWVCTECGAHGYLPHNSVSFAPTVCPGCGSSRWYAKTVARFAWRPRGLNVLRFRWVDREGREVGLAALEAEAES